MKIAKLEIEYHYDFLLFGLIAPHKEYKVAWTLNQLLNIDLASSSDIEIKYKNKSSLKFCSYLYETDYITFRLLRNKAIESEKIAKPYLLPELKEYDYFLVVEGDEDILDRQIIKKPLKESNLFTYIEEFDAQALKSKENLIF